MSIKSGLKQTGFVGKKQKSKNENFRHAFKFCNDGYFFLFLLLIIIALKITVNKHCQVSPWQRHVLETDTRPDVGIQTGALFPACVIVSSPCPQDESGAKPDARGDSAVSKGTTDSGVVMEGVQVPSLPGQVPRHLPVTDSESDQVHL